MKFKTKLKTIQFGLCSLLLILVYVSQVDDGYNACQLTWHTGHLQIGMIRERGLIALGYYQSRYLSPTGRLFGEHDEYYKVSPLLEGNRFLENDKSRVILPGVRYHHYRHSGQNQLLFISLWHPLLTVCITLLWGYALYQYIPRSTVRQKNFDAALGRAQPIKPIYLWLSRPGRHLKLKCHIFVAMMVLAFVIQVHDYERCLAVGYVKKSFGIFVVHAANEFQIGYVLNSQLKANGVIWENSPSDNAYRYERDRVDTWFPGIALHNVNNSISQGTALIISLYYFTFGFMLFAAYYKLRHVCLQHRLLQHACLKCGYDLRGTVYTNDKDALVQVGSLQGKCCPECGAFNTHINAINEDNSA